MHDKNARGREFKRLVKAIPLIRPIYLPETGSDLIELGETPIEIRSERETIKTIRRATVRVQPKVTLSITIDLPKAGIDLGEVDFRYGSGAGFERANVLHVEIHAGKAELTPNPQRVARDDQPLATLLFHVINFARFLESGPNSQNIHHPTSPNGFVVLGRIVLVDPPWQIELQEMPETKAIMEKLRKRQGMALRMLGN
jgi:hypothetical protein